MAFDKLLQWASIATMPSIDKSAFSGSVGPLQILRPNMPLTFIFQLDRSELRTLGLSLKKSKKLDKDVEERAHRSTFLPDESLPDGAASVLINSTDEGDLQ